MGRDNHHVGLHMIPWRNMGQPVDTDIVSQRKVTKTTSDAISLMEQLCQNPRMVEWVDDCYWGYGLSFSCVFHGAKCCFSVWTSEGHFDYAFFVEDYNCKNSMKINPLNLVTIIADIAVDPLKVKCDNNTLICPECGKQDFMLWHDKCHLKCLSCNSLYPCSPSMAKLDCVKPYRASKRNKVDYSLVFQDNAREQIAGDTLFEQYIAPVADKPHRFEWKIQQSSGNMILRTVNDGKQIMAYLSEYETSKIVIDGKAYRPPLFDPDKFMKVARHRMQI